MLSSGSRVDIAVAHGTPLHIAVSFGKTGVVKILLDHHSDVITIFHVFFICIILVARYNLNDFCACVHSVFHAFIVYYWLLTYFVLINQINHSYIVLVA